MTRRLAVAVAALTWAGAAAAGDEAWQRVDTAAFTVQLPKAATRGEQKADTATGPLVLVTWQLEKPDSMVIFSYTDFPPEAIAKSLPQNVLDGARDGSMANIGATL